MLKVKPFRQTFGYCGPASLKMVLNFYGMKKSEAFLAKLSGATQRKGVEAKGLAHAARQLGFSATIKNRATISDLRRYLKSGIPVIVDWFSVDDGHYSVVVACDRKNIYLQDPELGRRRALDIKTFERVWFDFPGDIIRSPRDIIIRRIIAISRRKKLGC